MRVLVTGGRDFDNPYALYDKLEELHNEVPITVLIQGGAKGADKFAKAWAEYNKITGEQYNADWEKDGKAAGPIRNAKMLKEGKPDLVVAFPGGAGTANMVKQARAAGVTVVEVECEKDWYNDSDVPLAKPEPVSSTDLAEQPSPAVPDVPLAAE